MPIYEYICNKCGKSFEQLQFASDGEAVSCPHCQSGDISRIMSCFATGGGGLTSPSGLGLASSPGGGHKCGSGGFS